MENEDWQEIVMSLVKAKRDLRNAWSVLDGTDGPAEDSEAAFDDALNAIDSIYAIESAHAFNADVASPVEVQAFWDEHGSLPGFAIGT